MVAADLNGDGKQDLVAVGSGTYVQLGNGDGTFQPAACYPDAGGWSVIARDVNGDGILDIVTVPYNANVDLVVLLGRGDGTFGAAERYAVAYGPVDNTVNATDLNRDGRADLVFYDGTINVLVTMYGNGPGLSGVATADVNGDSQRDVVAINTRNDRVKLLLGHGDNTFTRAFDLLTGTSPAAVAVRDLTGDGQPGHRHRQRRRHRQRVHQPGRRHLHAHGPDGRASAVGRGPGRRERGRQVGHHRREPGRGVGHPVCGRRRRHVRRRG